MISNYDKQVHFARNLFLTYDQETMIHKFRLQADKNWLYLNLLNRAYRVARDSGAVEYQSPAGFTECCDYQVVMTIYDVLCCAKTMPILAHQWCPVHGLQVTMSSPSADTFTKRYAGLFAGKTEQLFNACEKIGGHQPEHRAGADVCWQFEVFPFLPVQMRFWDGDDEFEPKLQLLWDKNTLDFIRFETTYYVQGYLMERLAKMIGTM